MVCVDIYIIKHADTSWNEVKKTQGHCDVELSEMGIKKAILLSGKKEIQTVKAIYSSDLKRAYQTIEPLAKKIDIPIIKLVGLREGNWKRYNIDSRYPPLAFEGGYEDNQMLRKRGILIMKKIVEQSLDTPILIVTHGSFLDYFIESISFKGNVPLKIRRVALNHIQYNQGVWKIIKLNDVAHLGGN